MHLFWRSGSFFSFVLRCLRPDRGKQPTSGKQPFPGCRLFPPGRRIWEQNKIKLCEHIYIQWQNKTKQKINTILSRQLECVMCDILKKTHTQQQWKKDARSTVLIFIFKRLNRYLNISTLFPVIIIYIYYQPFQLNVLLIFLVLLFAWMKVKYADNRKNIWCSYLCKWEVTCN